jgi:deazaflavin-dependent oxidoreductase (nitroreductase family)
MRRLWLVVGGVAVTVVATAVYERVAPRSLVRAYQKHVGNRLFRSWAGITPGWAVVETTGRRSGRPHCVPVGGGMSGDVFWLVAGDGRQASYVKNIEADPRVRVRSRGRWRTGTAHLLDDDDARRRLLRLNPLNSAFIRVAGTELLTIRIDLEPRRLHHDTQNLIVSRWPGAAWAHLTGWRSCVSSQRATSYGPTSTTPIVPPSLVSGTTTTSPTTSDSL